MTRQNHDGVPVGGRQVHEFAVGARRRGAWHAMTLQSERGGFLKPDAGCSSLLPPVVALGGHGHPVSALPPRRKDRFAGSLPAHSPDRPRADSDVIHATRTVCADTLPEDTTGSQKLTEGTEIPAPTSPLGHSPSASVTDCRDPDGRTGSDHSRQGWFVHLRASSAPRRSTHEVVTSRSLPHVAAVGAAQASRAPQPGGRSHVTRAVRQTLPRIRARVFLTFCQ